MPMVGFCAGGHASRTLRIENAENKAFDRQLLVERAITMENQRRRLFSRTIDVVRPQNTAHDTLIGTHVTNLVNLFGAKLIFMFYHFALK